MPHVGFFIRRYWILLMEQRDSYQRGSLRSDWPSYIMKNRFSALLVHRIFHTLNSIQRRKNGIAIMMGWDVWLLE